MSNDTAAREAASTLLLSRKNIKLGDIGSENIHQKSASSEQLQDEQTESTSSAQQQTPPSSKKPSSNKSAKSAQTLSQKAMSVRNKIPLSKKKLLIVAGVAFFIAGSLIWLLYPQNPKTNKPESTELSGFGKQQQTSELSLTPPSQTDQQKQGSLSLEPEITKLPEIPSQPTVQSSVEIDELKEKLATLEEEIANTKAQLTEKETELRSLSQSMTSLKTNITNNETALAKLPKLEDEISNIKNLQAYEKSVAEEERNKSDFQILSEDSIEIYGKVYYVGSIIKYDNKRYVIKKIDFNNGVFLQDGAQQVYRLPIKK